MNRWAWFAAGASLATLVMFLLQVWIDSTEPGPN